ncbi:hypothetical protein OHA79_52610 (plasmid) [Streptomyces sp. NBC_00841]|nr:hypothetical protein [Streptomyces sp. NBC_00841]WSA06113.1 hypothetical protein OHA79_52610 [Streptomyces sp. NBC_00841]
MVLHPFEWSQWRTDARARFFARRRTIALEVDGKNGNKAAQ